MRKSRLSKKQQSHLQEHFVAGTTARCSTLKIKFEVIDHKPYNAKIPHMAGLEVRYSPECVSR